MPPEIASTEIRASAVGDDTAGKPRDSASLESVPIPMLPPRKRLKLSSRSEHAAVGRAEETGVATVEVSKAGHVDKNSRGNCFVGTLVESEQRPEIQPALANCEKELLQDSHASSGAVESLISADVVQATNFTSAVPINSFASPSVSQQTQESKRRGRKPHQTSSSSVSGVPLQPASLPHNSWATANGGEEPQPVALTPTQLTQLVATPTPSVIQIPEDARVLQTEDGMVIVCQSDGTIQIHGHTEGRPIPLDAIRSVLAMDTPVVAVDDSDPQQAVQSLCGQTGPQTDYGTMAQVMGADGAQSLVSVDGRQYVALDGGQAVVAFDPNTQSMVQIGQGIMALADGNTLVAVDGSQSLMSVDGGPFSEQWRQQLLG